MNSGLAWTLLIIAGVMEIIWVISMKQTEGFSRPGPTVLTLAVMAVSFILLAQALRWIPIGTAYAVWTGIGAAGAAICGILFFGEAASPARLTCLFLIVAGIAGLKLWSS